MEDESHYSDPTVPFGFIPSGRAIREFVISYGSLVQEQDRQRQTAVTQTGWLRRRAIKGPELLVNDLVLEAIKRGELNVVVLDVRHDWREIWVPPEHWCRTVGGADSVLSGMMMRVDEWPEPLPLEMQKAPVCFREEQWTAWKRKRAEDFGWPIAERGSGVLPEQTAELTQGQVNSWYKNRVRDWPEKVPSPSRDHDQIAARQNFGKVVGLKQMVRRARRCEAPKAWVQPGAKGHKVESDRDAKAEPKK